MRGDVQNPCVVPSGGRSVELTAACLPRQVPTCAWSRSTAASTSARVLQAPSTASACPGTRSTRMGKPAQVSGSLAPPTGGSESWTGGTGTAVTVACAEVATVSTFWTEGKEPTSQKVQLLKCSELRVKKHVYALNKTILWLIILQKVKSCDRTIWTVLIRGQRSDVQSLHEHLDHFEQFLRLSKVVRKPNALVKLRHLRNLLILVLGCLCSCGPVRRGQTPLPADLHQLPGVLHLRLRPGLPAEGRPEVLLQSVAPSAPLLLWSAPRSSCLARRHLEGP